MKVLSTGSIAENTISRAVFYSVNRIDMMRAGAERERRCSCSPPISRLIIQPSRHYTLFQDEGKFQIGQSYLLILLTESQMDARAKMTFRD